MLVVRNVPPQWNEEYESYTLNFYNRVKQASKKNFQVCEQNEILWLRTRRLLAIFHLGSQRAPLSRLTPV